MKKFVVVCMFVFLPLGLWGNAHAALVAGTYDLLNLLGQGTWNEELKGGHGIPGNSITASGPGWLVKGILQSVGLASDPSWQYQSTYGINLAVTVPGIWGEAIQIAGVSGTNLSRRDVSGNLEWYFTFSGFDAQYPSIPINFIAHFDIIPPTNPISGVIYYNDNQTLHGGSNLAQLTMQIVPIPAAAWLLGSGLLGLVLIRRRMKK